jgi:hypothetical protein
MGRFHLARFTNRAGRRQIARLGAVLSLLGTLAGLQPAQAENFQIESRVKDGYGWSGYWWPMLVSAGSHVYDTQGQFTPLLKYGQFTGDNRPLEWERRNGYTTDPSASWWGHCNGWAASAVLMQEPKRALRIRLQPGSPVVDFNVGDLKGLMAVAHQASPADFFEGNRRDSGATYQTDLRALPFHQALIDYLYERREGVVFNITPKPEVWNFPCYAFRMIGRSDANNPSVTWVTTTIWYSDDAVRPDFLGIKALSATYTYSIRGSWREPAAAEWTGQSVVDHPQFVWHPAYAQAYDPETQEENPIRIDIIKKLAQLSAGTNNAVAQ